MIQFVSLGGDCQPALQIRRQTGKQDMMFVFDWLATSVGAVRTLIQNDFADFFAPANLEMHPDGDQWRVIDTHYDITSLHHFKSKDDEHIDQVVRMFRYLARQFMEILRSDLPVCFVRRWRPGDEDFHELEARELYKTVCALKSNSVFLYLQEHEQRKPIIVGNYISAFSPATEPDGKWEGDDSIYIKNYALARETYDRLTFEEDRQVGHDNCVSWRGKILKIPQQPHRNRYVRATVRVHEYPDGSLAIFDGQLCLARYDRLAKLLDRAAQRAA
jgi:hypothetical protein